MILHYQKLSFAGLVLAFLLIFASCEDTFGIESILGNRQETTSFQGQVVLMDAIRDRLQVSDISLYDNICHIQFVGGSIASLNRDYFPLKIGRAHV